MTYREIPRIAFVSAMSGGGKTTAACAVMRAMSECGLTVSPFKCGPDYIDPLHHYAAAGRQGVNLDPFFSDAENLREIFCGNAAGADIAVIEGVMGFYDGMSFDSAAASTYEVTRTLGTPAVLVLRARGMAYSAAAVINGIVNFRPDSNIKAVILSDVTEMTYRSLKPVIEKECKIAAAGYIPRLEKKTESRHLGLVLPWESDGTALAEAAKAAAETVDIEMLLSIAKDAAGGTAPEQPKDTVRRTIASGGLPLADAFAEKRSGGHKKIRIAVAYDRAFCFYYKDNLDILESMGAEPVFFSPLKDGKIPDGVSGLLLGGGYPELFAKELSENTTMLSAVKKAIDGGMPCIAECGGFMYLHKRLEGGDGRMYDMASVIDSDAVKRGRLVRFGYSVLTAKRDGAYLKTGEHIKAHEFHYWDSGENGDGCMAEKPSGKRSWECVHTGGALFAGFPHLYFRSCPDFARRFVRQCGRYET